MVHRVVVVLFIYTLRKHAIGLHHLGHLHLSAGDAIYALVEGGEIICQNLLRIALRIYGYKIHVDLVAIIAECFVLLRLFIKSGGANVRTVGKAEEYGVWSSL